MPKKKPKKKVARRSRARVEAAPALLPVVWGSYGGKPIMCDSDGFEYIGPLRMQPRWPKWQESNRLLHAAMTEGIAQIVDAAATHGGRGPAFKRKVVEAIGKLIRTSGTVGSDHDQLLRNLRRYKPREAERDATIVQTIRDMRASKNPPTLANCYAVVAKQFDMQDDAVRQVWNRKGDVKRRRPK